MNLPAILLQAPAGGGIDFSFILMLVLLFIILYFFMIRPQQKRQKDLQKAREAIQNGDKIITSGGLYGKVREISEKYMLIEIAEGVKIRIDKAHIFPVTEEQAKK
ncbi:MAG: preprotein translocase subunit YajC [Tannerellaceae bacterium]|jgi:preprotein translocase subunit YajC|nr:preprotein translocase subunit YajC [Tannerellaceae bacterium]